MKLLRTIQALFRSRRAVGGEVRPTDHGDDIGPIEITPGGRCAR